MKDIQIHKGGVDYKLTLSSFAVIILLGISAVLYPDAIKSSMSSMLDFTVIKLGSGFLWYALLGTCFLFYLAFSKYGNSL